MTNALYDALGPRGKRKALLGSIVSAIILVAAAVWVLVQLAAQGQLDGALWAVLVNGNFLVLLMGGLLGTLAAAGMAVLLSLLVGIVLAMARLSLRRWLRVVTRWWIELFRGMPPLLLIFFIYLGAPALGADVSPYWALVLGLMLYNSSVMGEIFRAGILSLPKGQSEAAYSIGMRRGATMRLILLPQAVRSMLPALLNQVITLLKETSLGFIIGYVELLRDGRTAVEFLGGQYSLPVYTGIAVIYIGMNLLIAWLARRLTRKRQSRQTRPPRPLPPRTAEIALNERA